MHSNQEEDKNKTYLRCRAKGCKFTGPPLHFAHIYNTTLCPKHASAAVWKRNQFFMSR